MPNRSAEWIIPLDAHDPLHAEMLDYLRAVRTRGRYSPVRRILARWAANGYLLELGRIPGGSVPDTGAMFDALAAVGLLADTATPEALAEALATLTGLSASSRPARLDLAQAREEIAAIEAAAAAIDFE
jgi:hypothetical protein